MPCAGHARSHFARAHTNKYTGKQGQTLEAERRQLTATGGGGGGATRRHAAGSATGKRAGRGVWVWGEGSMIIAPTAASLVAQPPPRNVLPDARAPPMRVTIPDSSSGRAARRAAAAPR